MPLNESDTRAKLIDPALHSRGWTEDLIRREETAGAVEIIDGKARRQAKGKADYVLRVKVIRTSRLSLLRLSRPKPKIGRPLLVFSFRQFSNHVPDLRYSLLLLKQV